MVNYKISYLFLYKNNKILESQNIYFNFTIFNFEKNDLKVRLSSNLRTQVIWTHFS